MNKVLQFIQEWCRISSASSTGVSRERKEATGSGSPTMHEDGSAFLTGGSVVSCTSCQQLPDYRPPVERAFCFDDAPHINAIPPACLRHRAAWQSVTGGHHAN